VSSCYLDASAIAKLVTDEPESAALRQWVGTHTRRLTSRITTVEVPRALRRKGPKSVELAERALDAAFQAMTIVELDQGVAHAASQLDPPALRSLDAVHLASALVAGPELDGFVTYDLRLADAARTAGLEVVAPG
jgi:predicted nucleic acid-binding protein